MGRYSAFNINVAPPLSRRKMITEAEKQIIYKMKDENATWKLIGIAINKKGHSVRRWYQRNRINRDLPPKVKVSKRLTDGRVGLAIKKIAKKTLICLLEIILLFSQVV